ncbi:hypothetical protein CUS_5049 [Ruminococcus albus 8]|uniref:Uncharacterized protein n=1 Tax=Ruminococcus albus 8 TaxID=246199 RepID=E9SD96_RUMAL|nr:hypothetical protein CUS_5049 [Ruminococcus albus 8]
MKKKYEDFVCYPALLSSVPPKQKQWQNERRGGEIGEKNI